MRPLVRASVYVYLILQAGKEAVRKLLEQQIKLSSQLPLEIASCLLLQIGRVGKSQFADSFVAVQLLPRWSLELQMLGL